MKLNVLLAKTEALSHVYQNLIKDFGRFFLKAQGAFRGERRTYQPREGTVDEPSKRGSILIQTTVNQKLEWFLDNSRDYIDALFSQEKTNASGLAKADLIVAGESWGEFTSLELLRLKSVLENGHLANMLTSIPVRSDAEEWVDSNDPLYPGIGVKEGPIERGTNITTTKKDYILKDPNVGKDSPNYTPMVAQQTTIVELGEYTRQRFNGEWSQLERAMALKRRSDLHIAVHEALKRSNEVEIIKSNLTAEKLFGYILGL